MKNTFILILFLVFGFVSAQIPKGKLLIIGGGDSPDFLIDRMVKEAGLKKGEYVAIFPQASSIPDSSFIYTSEDFEKRDLKTLNYYFNKGEKLSKARLDSLKKAKLIFISGGDQTKFMELINSYPEVKDIIKTSYFNGNMIAGTSAGAAVMSGVMITGNQLKHKEYNSTFNNIETNNVETQKGLGFITSAVIDQHFIIRSRYNRLLSLIIDHPKLKGIGIDESTAILIKNGEAEVVGKAQVIIFKNPRTIQDQLKR
ncbi:cyanophycinase [Elizabethkingia anophelis]|uniref:Cyanophycinase n=1 Tax=Elizabethkingia anophelis TaxID=1117645 RepID=A0A7Z7LTH7_9FLAO|nr:cyanophycinase [Elizabethkingia anophelis]STC94634.1 Cyanophycinase [Elizabethkingia anophelis]